MGDCDARFVDECTLIDRNVLCVETWDRTGQKGMFMPSTRSGSVKSSSLILIACTYNNAGCSQLAVGWVGNGL